MRCNSIKGAILISTTCTALMPPTLHEQKLTGMPGLLDLAGVVPKKEESQELCHGMLVPVTKEEVAKRPAANTARRVTEEALAKRPAAHIVGRTTEESSVRKRPSPSVSVGAQPLPASRANAITSKDKAGGLKRETPPAVKAEDVAKRPAASITGQSTLGSVIRKRPSASVSGVQPVPASRRFTVATQGKVASSKRRVLTAVTCSSLAKMPTASSSSTAGVKDSPAVWWSCPRCDFSILASVPVRKRNAAKRYHIRSAHGNSKLARTGNYLHRSKMLRAIWDGILTRSPGGLRKADLKANAKGRIVPKRRSAHSSKNCKKSGWAASWRQWCHANAALRQEQGITGFVKIKKTGTPQDRSVYLKVLERWAKTKAASMTKSLASAGSHIEIVASARSQHGVEVSPNPALEQSVLVID